MVKGFKISMPIKPIVKTSSEEKPQSKVELTKIKDNDSNKQQQLLLQIPLEDQQQQISLLKQSKKSFHKDFEISQNELSNSPKRLRSVHRSMDFILSERSNSLFDKKHILMKEIEIKNQLIKRYSFKNYLEEFTIKCKSKHNEKHQQSKQPTEIKLKKQGEQLKLNNKTKFIITQNLLSIKCLIQVEAEIIIIIQFLVVEPSIFVLKSIKSNQTVRVLLGNKILKIQISTKKFFCHSY
ncbi:hypothetical protein ABPG72_015980 [Tetrahymena utriculariae]